MRNRLSSRHDEGGIAMHQYIWLAAALVATLAVLTGSAVAAPPQVLHSNDSGTVQDVDFCGITTDLAFRFSQTEMLFFDKDGNIVRHDSTGSVRNTFTAAN